MEVCAAYVDNCGQQQSDRRQESADEKVSYGFYDFEVQPDRRPTVILRCQGVMLASADIAIL
jgi:hypothetical protein